MMIRVTLLLAATLFLPQITYAQSDAVFIGIVDPQMAALGSHTKFKIIVRDEISDGCWRSPSSAKTKAELAMIRNGFGQVIPSDSNEFAARIWLNGFGYEHSAGGPCFVVIKLSLESLRLY